MRILGNSGFKINECFNYILLSSSSAQVCGTGVLLGLDFCFVATSRNAFSTGANYLQPVDTISSDLVISAEKCSTKLHPNKSAPPAGELGLAEKEATAASTKMQMTSGFMLQLVAAVSALVPSRKTCILFNSPFLVNILRILALTLARQEVSCY